VFFALLSLDYGGFVATLPDSSVALGMALAPRYAAYAADRREDWREAWSTENLAAQVDE
jgi:hypothetical protein